MSFTSKTVSLLTLALLAGFSYQARAEEWEHFPAQYQIESRQIHATHAFCNMHCAEMKMEVAKPPMIEESIAAPILFGTASDKLSAKAENEIKKIAAMVKSPKFGGRHVFVRGYTDNAGKEAANLKLSTKRATMVMKKLVKLGVPASQLTAEGFGSNDPVADNRSKAGRALNRRVTFTALQKR